MRRPKITVHREGYHQRSYRRRDGVYVDPADVPATTYKMEDRGEPGKTPLDDGK